MNMKLNLLVSALLVVFFLAAYFTGDMAEDGGMFEDTHETVATIALWLFVAHLVLKRKVIIARAKALFKK
jgi:hypothetical protein